MFVSVHKKPESCSALKNECLEAAEDGDCAFVSTNDAVCAELAAAIALEGQEKVPITMIVEFRHLLPSASSVVGNLWTVLEFWPRASLAGAADIRRWLPHITKEMIEWHLGQAMIGMNPSWPGQLMMNSWVKAFQLRKFVFASAPTDMMVGAFMMRQRAQGMIPRGISYCIALPRAGGGVKLAALLPEAAVEQLRGNGYSDVVNAMPAV